MQHKKTNLFFDRIQKKLSDESEPAYMHVICSEFLCRAGKNPNYSLRAYARDLGLDPGHLSRILLGKRLVRFSTANAISERLRLTDHDRKTFLNSLSKVPH